MEEAMSLNRKDKEALNQAILRLAKIINDLENTTAIDPRVLDMMEICGSLIEQQIEMDIVFEQCDADEMHDEVTLIDNNIIGQDHEVVHIKFTDNEEEDKDIPSAEEIQQWFNLGE